MKNKMYSTKKKHTYSSWASICLRWLLWACVNLRWLLWAFVGFIVIKKEKRKCTLQKKTYLSLFRLCGPALAFVGCCGPALTCVGRRWLPWAFVGFVVINN